MLLLDQLVNNRKFKLNLFFVYLNEVDKKMKFEIRQQFNANSCKKTFKMYSSENYEMIKIRSSI